MSTDTYLPPVPMYPDHVEWIEDGNGLRHDAVLVTELPDGLYLFGAMSYMTRLAIGPMDYMGMDSYLSICEGPEEGEALGIMSDGRCVEFVPVEIATNGTVTWPSIPN